MNLLAIFDLDGVLLDSRELHYEALNEAIIKCGQKFRVITPEEHLSTYDGLPTRRKLELLTEKKDLPRKLHDAIYRAKQEITIEKLSHLGRDYKLQQYFRRLKSEGIKIAVCSNSIRDTVVTVLSKLGLMELTDYFVTNEDVPLGKPYPYIFWNAIQYFRTTPENTVIFEDSPVGRQGAKNSGASLIPVDSREKFTEDKISLAIKMLKHSVKKSAPFAMDGLNIVIPCAGLGSRFAQAGYTFPKPLIEVFSGKTMIQTVVDNLNVTGQFIFIVQRTHFDKYNLGHFLNVIAPGSKVITVDGVTEGAACSVLLAKEYIDNNHPLLLANSDQYLEWNSAEVLSYLMADNIDGGIVTFEANHPKWSYAKLGDDGLVSEVAEKKVISNLASTGVYTYKRGSDFVKYAEQMIRRDVRVNGEYYVCPVFNQMLEDGKKIREKGIEKMWGLGVPEDLEYFLKNHKGLS